MSKTYIMDTNVLPHNPHALSAFEENNVVIPLAVIEEVDKVDDPYLDASSNGLTYLVEKLKGETVSGHVTLNRGERSMVAELGAKLL